MPCLLALWVLLWLGFFADKPVLALSPELEASFQEQLLWIAERSPAYTWGGSESLERGLDCSGYIFLAAKWAGIPGVKRTTSRRMAEGEDGWEGDETTFAQKKATDIVFYTWQLHFDRPDGHTGAVVRYRDRLGLAHASSGKRRVVVVPFEGVLRDDISRIKRLRMGE